MLVIGHRGAAGHVTENTLASFDKALELGCQMIEMDVRRCQGDDILVFHDDTLERLAGSPERIEEMQLAEVRRVRLQGKQPIPTLEETLAHINGRAIACIEVKEQGMAEPLADMLKYALRKGEWNYKNLYVISFFHQELVMLRDLVPDIRIAPIMCALPVEQAAFASEIDAYGVHPCIHFLDKAFVEDAHKRGLKVMVWTADSAHDIEKAWKLGVDGITSNYPDRILAHKPA